MTQSCLNRAVARATGESLATVRRLGFSFVDQVHGDDLTEPAKPNVVDWDDIEAQRMVLFPVRQSRAGA